MCVTNPLLSKDSNIDGHWHLPKGVTQVLVGKEVLLADSIASHREYPQLFLEWLQE
jgi:hypothetical protein